jgi:glycosyltransferase involved in cell wall biosynthesis
VETTAAGETSAAELAGRPLKSFHVGISWSTQGAGGSGRIFADLWRELPRCGVEFRGAVSAPAGVADLTEGRVQNLAPAGAGFAGRLLGARRTIRRSLSEWKPDVVASHFALFVAPAIDLLKRQPHVVHFHGPWAAESQAEGARWLAARSKRLVELSVYRRADRAVVLSQAFADVIRSDYGVPESKVRIVPGAVDLDRFAVSESRAAARERLGWPTDRPILISVRRLVRRMGLSELIEAMAAVRQRHPDVLLLIAGKGRLRGEFESLIERLGLKEHVRLLGFVPDEVLPLLYRAADLNVVPTQSLEGFGLVAAEALAAGTPSLVTPVGGLPEVVRGLSAKLVFASTRRSDIEEHLTQVLSGSVQLPSEMACREYAADQFSPKLMAARVAAVYRELV